LLVAFARTDVEADDAAVPDVQVEARRQLGVQERLERDGAAECRDGRGVEGQGRFRRGGGVVGLDDEAAVGAAAPDDADPGSDLAVVDPPPGDVGDKIIEADL